jgi:hypothetical protein
MQLRSTLGSVAVVLACLAAKQASLAACSCVGTTPSCQATWEAHGVFAGEVVEIADLPRPADRASPDVFSGFYRRRVTFRVTEAFRGEVGRSVTIFTGQGGGDCGYAFDLRRTYLVYAHRVPTGELTTGICSRTRPVADAAEDLAYLRGPARAPSAFGTIQGAVKYQDPSLPYVSFDKAAPHTGGTLTLEATGAGRKDRYETRTGDDGRFEVKVPVGRYRATLAVRDGLYAEGSYTTLEVLDTRGCAQANFAVRPDGRIRGRVVDVEGGAVPDLSVEVIEAAATRNNYFTASRRSRTDAGGQFEFSKLAPGDYVIGLTLTKELKASVTNAIWVEPAVPGLMQPIAIVAEQRVDVGDVRLPASVSLAFVSGAALLEDGKPAIGARVYVLTSPEFGIAAGPIDVDRDGAFSFAVVAGRQYRLSAELLGAPSRWRKAESSPFTPVAGATPAFLLAFQPRGER